MVDSDNPVLGGPRTMMGLDVKIVEPGTTVTDERTGERVTVTDEVSAVAWPWYYCTKVGWGRLLITFEQNKSGA
jgi:hypothetical protein